MVESQAETIQESLVRSAGVHPSKEWVEACISFLQEEDIPVTSDGVLHQVLHSDLRDVVRSSNNVTAEGEPATIVQIQQRLEESMKGKQNLPENFQLLCQVEELLDVSLNAEARLAVGPAAAENPSPVGNQRSRCLKLVLSHGHFTQTPLIAMETAPITNLSTNSLAGLKLLLKGPLTIRYGVVMLHPGNATVLGGGVAELIQIQKQALEQAKQVAGIGVDATVRALIGTTPVEPEEPEDEAEEESRDVPLQAAPVFIQNTANNRNAMPAREMPPPLNTTLARQSRPSVDQRPANGMSTTATSSFPSTNNANGTLRSNPYVGKSVSKSSSISPRPSTFSAASTRTSVNPYAGGRDSASSSSSTGNSSNNNPLATPASRPVNPYFSQPSTATVSSMSSTTSIQQRSENPYRSTSLHQTPASNMKTSNTSVSMEAVSESSSSRNTKLHTASSLPLHVTPSNKEPMPSPMETKEAASDTKEAQNMTFGNLKRLLRQLVQDRDMYSSYYNGKLQFRVQLVQEGPQLYFNIEKNPNYKKMKKEQKEASKYQFVMNTTFSGAPNSQDGLLACKLPSILIEPFFSKTPVSIFCFQDTIWNAR